MNPPRAGEHAPTEEGGGAALLAHLTEWRRVTELESQAIRQGQWDQLLGLQAIKQRLQREIDAALEDARPTATAEAKGSAPGAAQGVAAELIELERANQQLLAGRRDQALAERASAEVSRANLKRLQTRFVARPASSWQCYS